MLSQIYLCFFFLFMPQTFQHPSYPNFLISYICCNSIFNFSCRKRNNKIFRISALNEPQNQMKNIAWCVIYIIYNYFIVMFYIYITILNLFVVVYKMSYPLVPLKCLSILLVFNQCACFGFSINLETEVKTYIISYLVGLKCIKLPTNLFYVVGSTFFLEYFLLNVKPMAIFGG